MYTKIKYSRLDMLKWTSLDTLKFIVLALIISITGAMCLWSSNNYNPNAEHYCAYCKKLEWECDCPDC